MVNFNAGEGGNLQGPLKEFGYGGAGGGGNETPATEAEKFIREILDKRTNNNILCYGLLLYRLRDNFIKDILDNQNKLIAINEIAGKKLSFILFSPQEIKNFEALLKPDEITNNILKEVFKIEEKIEYPCLLFFQVYNGYIIDYFFMELISKLADEAFKEIVDILETGEKALDKIKPEFRKEKANVFNQFEDSIKGEYTKRKFIKGFKQAGMLLKPVKIITGLLT